MHEFVHQRHILGQVTGHIAHNLHDVVFVEGGWLG
jgi:hypothetical protein